MEYKEIVNGSKKVCAPDLDHNSGKKIKNKKAILKRLKAIDQKTRVGIRLIQAAYIFLTLFILCFLIIAKSNFVKMGIISIALAFLLVIFVQQLRFRKYNYSYYSKPVIAFLNDAKKRMKVFTSRTWLVIPTWILLDIGLSLIIYEVFPFPEYTIFTLLIMQVVLLLLIVLDFYVAYLVWKKEHKPVITKIDKLLKEIAG